MVRGSTLAWIEVLVVELLDQTMVNIPAPVGVVGWAEDAVGDNVKTLLGGAVCLL